MAKAKVVPTRPPVSALVKRAAELARSSGARPRSVLFLKKGEKHNAKVVLGESPLPNPFAAEAFLPSDDLSPKAKVLRRSHAAACNAA